MFCKGSISTPRKYPFIFLFAGQPGEEYGYSDGWKDDQVYLYSGEGVYGDMVFERGNRAIRDHLSNGKTIYLFEASRVGHVVFVGEMYCVGFQYRTAPDFSGNDRRAIVFQLSPIERENAERWSQVLRPELPEESIEFSKRALADLRKIATEAATYEPTTSERTTIYRYRSRAIKAYALKRSQGTCAGCSQPAPFKTRAGLPFLEVHHLDRLADDGPDHPEAVIAVCPNCHRRAHYSNDAEAFNEQLRDAASEQELRFR